MIEITKERSVVVKVEIDNVVLSCAMEYAQHKNVSFHYWIESAIVHYAGQCEDEMWQPTRPVDNFARDLFLHMYINCRHELPLHWTPVAALIDADHSLWGYEPVSGSFEEFSRECYGDTSTRVLDREAVKAAWPRLVSRVF